MASFSVGVRLRGVGLGDGALAQRGGRRRMCQRMRLSSLLSVRERIRWVRRTERRQSSWWEKVYGESVFWVVSMFIRAVFRADVLVPVVADIVVLS